MNERAADYRQLIRTISGFPRSGIASRDWMPALMPVALRALAVV